jgi:hypothetical protein
LPTYFIPQPNEFSTFGNADIASQINESSALLDSLLYLQSQNVSTGGMSREVALTTDLVKKIPQDIDYDYAYQLA